MKILLNHANIDISGITETKLYKKVVDKALGITGYKLIIIIIIMHIYTE